MLEVLAGVFHLLNLPFFIKLFEDIHNISRSKFMFNTHCLIKQFLYFEHRRIRAIMRAYRKIGNLKKFREIKEGFVDIDFNGNPNKISKLIFGACKLDAKTVVKQLIIQRLSGDELTKKILYQLEIGAAQTYALPSDFRRVLHNNGVVTSALSSVLAWSWLVAKYWAYGFATAMNLFLIGVKNSCCRTKKLEMRFAYFLGLNHSNLPVANGVGSDILTWYLGWAGRDTSLEVVAHDAVGGRAQSPTIIYLPHPYMQLKGWVQIWLFFSWCFKATFLTAILALQGKWWAAFVFSEAAKAKAVSLISIDKLAAEFFFHFSGSVYRPMWTYEAIERGAKVTCYFYSTSEQIRMPNEAVSQRFVWGAANWPKYLVWDEYQAEVIRRDINYGNVEIVGPISFTSTHNVVPKMPTVSISVFDLQPHRTSLQFGIGTLAEYIKRFPGVEYRFLLEIEAALGECGVHMAIKPKRRIGVWGAKKYNRLLENLSNKRQVTLVNPEVSPTALIDSCQAVLSFPFTATAVNAKYIGKPSAYYDPMSWISKDDPGAHGIAILHGSEELRSWICRVISVELADDVRGHQKDI